jgi:hypothetical protein
VEQRECAHQKGAGARRRVKDCDIEQCPPEQRIRFVERAGELRFATADARRKVRGQRFPHHRVNERRRREECALLSAFGRVHDSLEDPAEKLRRDPSIVSFAVEGHFDSLNERFERLAPISHRKVHVEAAFDRVRLEEPAVEEGNRAEGTRESRPLVTRTIQCAEEERMEKVTRRVTVRDQAAIKRSREEAHIPVEPTLSFYESEEEEAGELHQRPSMPIICRDRPRQHLDGPSDQTMQQPECLPPSGVDVERLSERHRLFQRCDRR